MSVRVTQVVPANPGWWATFTDADMLAVASWALVEDVGDEPLLYLSAFLEGEGVFVAHELANFEAFVYEPAPGGSSRRPLTPGRERRPTG